MKQNFPAINPVTYLCMYIKPCHIFQDGVGAFIREEVPVSSPGGIYNLEFNSDGKILAAACEKHNILIFDPLLRKQIASIDEAHTDCVNCIRYNKMIQHGA